MLGMRHVATLSWEMAVLCLVVSVISSVGDVGLIDQFDDDLRCMMAQC